MRFVIALIACSVLFAQDPRQVIVIAGRASFLEVIDPVTLETLSRIHFDFPAGSVGFNGVTIGADGSIYFEGPIPTNPRSCCATYALDPATRKAKVVASIPGTSSRDQFVVSDGLTYFAADLFMPISKFNRVPKGVMHLSPDAHWIFEVSNFQGPALWVYDLTRGEYPRELTPARSEEGARASGGWAGNSFYFFIESKQNSSHLWKLSPEATELGPGVPVENVGYTSGCTQPAFSDLLAAGDKVFLYEPFGFKGDRRERCHVPVPGGVWMIDPATGRQVGRTAIGLHFSTVVADRTGTFLYGLASEGLNQQGPGQLLRIDANDGHVSKFRDIEPGFFRMTVASVASVPKGEVFASIEP